MFMDEPNLDGDEAKDIEKFLERWPLNDFACWKGAFPAIAPPPQINVDEWSDRYRVIAPEFSAQPGKWDTRRVPFWREVMQACSPSHPARRIVICKPVQAGATEAALLNVIGYYIHACPRSMIVVLPSIEMAEALSQERLAPMIKMTPELHLRVADVLPGPSAADRSSIRKKKFPGGFLLLVGANSVPSLSSRPVGITICDEVDQCVAAAATSSDPLRLLTARTTTYGSDVKQIFIGSPSLDEEQSGILQLYSDSSRGWLETMCPNEKCQAWQVLSWEQLDLNSARLRCLQCGEAFGQHKWHGREQSRRWRHQNPEHPFTLGYRMSSLDSPWTSWERDLIPEYQEAKRIEALGDASLMRTFTNVRLARSYKPASKAVKIDLYERREVYNAHLSGAELPSEVKHVTAAVDVMDDRLVYAICGWGDFRESWWIETATIHGDPRNSKSEVWDRIDMLLCRRILRFPDGQRTRIRQVLIDSGGHCTEQVYRFCAQRQPRVLA